MKIAAIILSALASPAFAQPPAVATTDIPPSTAAAATLPDTPTELASRAAPSPAMTRREEAKPGAAKPADASAPMSEWRRAYIAKHHHQPPPPKP